MRKNRLAVILSISVAALGLNGCATMEGSPRRLFDDAASMSLVNRYPIDGAITLFSLPDTAENNQLRGGLTRQQFRDMVVIIYMNAMDGRYHEFRRALSSERRQTDLGMDLAVLGFTGWASVARESIVNNLSAIAAGFAGARNSINRNLYFDQTLPALISAMDAQRFRARAQMMRNLQRSDGDYPLPTAFSDLFAYEVASTLDSAISEITADAAQNRDDAARELANVTQSCDAESAAVPLAGRLASYVEGLASPTPTPPATVAANELKLRRVAVLMELPPAIIAEPAANLSEAILERLSTGETGSCRAAELEDLIARIEQLTGDDI